MNHKFPESSSIGTLSSQKLKDNGSFSLNLFYANKKGLLVKDMMKSPSYRVYPRLKRRTLNFVYFRTGKIPSGQLIALVLLVLKCSDGNNTNNVLW